MYERGDAKLGSDQFDADELEDGCSIVDNRADSAREICDPRQVVVLPHSCDSWVIGGREQVEAMIVDLTVLRDRLTA